jgi:hypothetical protein
VVVLWLGCLTWAQTDHVLKEEDRARDFSITTDEGKHKQLAATIRGGSAGVTESLVAQFDRSDVIVLGELHWTREDSDLRITLVHHKDFPKKVKLETSWWNARGGPIPADSTLVPLLDKSFPGRVYTVLPIAGATYRDTAELERLIQGAKLPVLLPTKGTPFGALDPNEFIGEPLRLVFQLFPHGVTLAEVTDACVYRGQASDTTVNPDPAVEADKIYAAEKECRCRKSGRVF